MEKTIDILIVEPGKAPRPACVEHTLENLQDIVGGQLEIGCFLPQRVLFPCRKIWYTTLDCAVCAQNHRARENKVTFALMAAMEQSKSLS